MQQFFIVFSKTRAPVEMKFSQISFIGKTCSFAW